MDTSATARIKSAMVIYELERALGRIARSNPQSVNDSEIALEIAKRDSIKKNVDGVGAIIEGSYLSEVFSLASAACAESSNKAHLDALKETAVALGLHEIRNAISHPNRPFTENYWHRACVIATEPAVLGLDLHEVTSAYESAMADTLLEPPEEWMLRRKWTIPTGLQDDFDHSITGLLGRNKDSAKLLRELKNIRSPLISIVAPGGIGKTSLALQAISDFCIAPEIANYADCVLFASLKQERLTSNGLELIDAPSSMLELESALAEQASELIDPEILDFTVLKEKFTSKRVWLLLDNLETLLRDDPGSFLSFYEDLPPSWKVIVTSRIPVDGAKNIPLGPLEDQGAFALARSYFSSKGQAIDDSELIDKIINGCKNNPLAIRLTIDSHIAGRDISEALSKSTSEIIRFSFSNLIEALPRTSQSVLECIFVFEECTRTQICDALSIGADAASSAISDLARTSLIHRKNVDTGEVYVLAGSIRELLRGTPIQSEARSKTHQWIRKSIEVTKEAQKLQRERNIPKVDQRFIPEYASATQIEIHKRIAIAEKIEDKFSLIQAERELRELTEQKEANSFVHRLYARVLLALEDKQPALSHYQRAVQLDEDDPSPKLSLARMLFDAADYEKSEKLCRQLIDAGWGDYDVSGSATDKVWNTYLNSVNYQERLNDTFSATENWKECLETVPAIAAGRASAYRRQADLEFRNKKADNHRLGSLLAKCAKILSTSFDVIGASKANSSELRKFVDELEFYSRKSINNKSFKELDAQEISDFLARKSDGIFSACRVDERSLNAANLAFLLSTQPNLVKQQALEKSAADYKSKGFKVVRIKNIPRGDEFPKFMFAYDESGIDYYVNVNCFENGNWRKWSLLRVGSAIAVKDAGVGNRPARQVLEARSLS